MNNRGEFGVVAALILGIFALICVIVYVNPSFSEPAWNLLTSILSVLCWIILGVVIVICIIIGAMILDVLWN